MERPFSGKRILVTGAGRGIGRECVSHLVSAGATVVALSKTEANLLSLRNQFPNTETHCVDVGDWDATSKLIKSLGPIDGLVNNAAVAHLRSLVTDLVTEEDCDRTFDVNVKSVINISQLVAQGMKERGTGGSIVNISSQAGIGALKDHIVYAASKAALDMVTKIFALEFGPYNIRTNSVNPTVTMTDMGRVGWSDETKAKEMRDKIPLNRFAEPSDMVVQQQPLQATLTNNPVCFHPSLLITEVADVILYLLSDKSSMVNGIVMPVDGGYTCC